MEYLGQALQTLNQTWSWAPDDIRIDAIDLVHLEGIYTAPVGTLVDRVDVTAIHRILGEDDILRVRADDRFDGHLWKPSIDGVIMKDINAIGILDKLIIKGATAEDIWLILGSIIRLNHHPWRCCASHFRFHLAHLLLQLI